MKVIVDGTPVVLDNRNVLGSGGEGTVYKVTVGGDKMALKVYEQPTKDRSDKLLAFARLPRRFTDRVIAPQSLAMNTAGLAVGFTMPIITGTFYEIAKLANKKFRTNFGVTTKDVVTVFLDGIPTLQNAHAQGFVVGDLNDLNVLTQGKRMLWWDVDSWQFGRFPCPVATETFLDPGLYNVDFSLRPVFTPGNDWYAYATMLFKSLLLVHPYGGVHKTLARIPDRAINRVTVFDKQVTYPVIALSPDILSDDMYGVFESYFRKGQRAPFPSKVLEEYLHSLRECTTCGAYFPANRGNCPVCSAKMVIVVQKPLASTKDIEVVELIRVNGQILAVRVVENEVRAIANEKNVIVLYTKRSGLPAVSKQLFANVPGSKYEMTETHLFVNRPGEADILVYDIATGNLLGKLSTRLFGPTRKAAFRASNQYLFRVDGVDLKYGRMVNGSFEERVLRQVMEDQTWFWVDQLAEEPYVFGLFQVVRQQVYWMVKEGKFFDVAIPQLETSEVLLDIAVKFSSQGVYLLRKTQQNGRNYLRQDMVDADGKVVFTNKVEESSHPHAAVHGLAYATGLVLHPTDDGVMQEKVRTGETKVFAATRGHVDGDDTLFRFGNSILASRQDRVVQITLK